MMLEPIFQTLQTSPVFTPLTESEKKALAAQGTIREYAVDEEVFSTEQEGDAFYMVLSGELFLRLRNNDRRFLKPGALFGEVSIFDERTRTGTVRVREKTQLARFEKDLLFKTERLGSALQLKLVQLLSRHMVSYFYKDAPSIRELIRQGESEKVEFKKSASSEEDARLELVQNIVSMANNKGGTILIGVENDGRIVGVNRSKAFKDSVALSLENLMKSKLGQYEGTLFSISTETIENHCVMRIDCESSPHVIIWREKKGDAYEEILWVRTNTENTRIRSLSDCARYMEKRCRESR